MKKIFMLFVLFTATSLFVSGQSANKNRSEEELRRLNAQEVAAFLQNDVSTLKNLWSDNFVVTNPFNKFINKQQVLALTESGNIAFTSYNREIEYIRFYQKIAIVVGNETVVWAGKMPIAGQKSLLRFTSVWEKKGGRWQEIARHANIVAQK